MILASQGSLAGLELLAARGSMRPNGSMNNSVYVNPFDPTTKRKAIGRTIKGSPKHHMKMSSRSRSNDLSELDLSSKGYSLDNLEQKNKRCHLEEILLQIAVSISAEMDHIHDANVPIK